MRFAPFLLLLLACSPPPLSVSPDARIPICESGPIRIVADCSERDGWRCQVPDDPGRPPCLIPNLSRLLVSSCEECPW